MALLKSKTASTIFIILLLLLFCYLARSVYQFFAGPTISDTISTYTEIYVLAVKINDNFKKTGILINKLDDLPEIPSAELFDAWGTHIIYEKERDGYVFLVSFGEDGKKGGSGAASDIIFYFDPRDTDSIVIGGDSIPETTNTKYKMRYFKVLIMKYYREYGKLPDKLDELQISCRFFTNDDKDYWGNPLVYEKKDGQVFLVSCGLDGKRGDSYYHDHLVSFDVVNLK